MAMKVSKTATKQATAGRRSGQKPVGQKVITVSVISISGRQLAVMDAKPFWQLQRVLKAVPEQPGESALSRRKILFGVEELVGERTLGNLGVASGAQLTLLLAPRRCVLAGCFYRNKAKLFCAETGLLLTTFSGHDSRVVSAVFSPDDRLVLTASEDKTAKIWSTSGECLRTLEGHSNGLTAALFSPDGRSILTACCRGFVKVWRGEAWECCHQVRAHRMFINSAAFSPDSHQFLTASIGACKLWSAVNGECLRTFMHEAFSTVAFSPTGLLISSRGRLQLYPKVGGECVHSIDLPARCCAVSSDGQQLLIATGDGLTLWSVPLGDCVQTLDGHADSVHAAAFSPDGKEVVVSLVQADEYSTKLWCCRTGVCLRTFPGDFTSAVISR